MDTAQRQELLMHIATQQIDCAAAFLHGVQQRTVVVIDGIVGVLVNRHELLVKGVVHRRALVVAGGWLVQMAIVVHTHHRRK